MQPTTEPTIPISGATVPRPSGPSGASGASGADPARSPTASNATVATMSAIALASLSFVAGIAWLSIAATVNTVGLDGLHDWYRQLAVVAVIGLALGLGTIITGALGLSRVESRAWHAVVSWLTLSAGILGSLGAGVLVVISVAPIVVANLPT